MADNGLHCPGCHGHPYSEWHGCDDADCGREDEGGTKVECSGIPSREAEIERLKASLRDLLRLLEAGIPSHLVGFTETTQAAKNLLEK